MPMFLFNDGSVEIACPCCDSTSPRTTAQVHANDRYNCPACNTEITLLPRTEKRTDRRTFSREKERGAGPRADAPHST